MKHDVLNLNVATCGNTIKNTAHIIKITWAVFSYANSYLVIFRSVTLAPDLLANVPDLV